jgi:hypothetical protein
MTCRPKLDRGSWPGTGGHETGLSVLLNAINLEFHVVLADLGLWPAVLVASA